MMESPMTTIGSVPGPYNEMPIGRIVRAYLREARYETINGLRTIGASVPFIVIPVVVYVLFGIIMFTPDPNSDLASEPGLVNYLLCGFASLAAFMPGIFSGVNLAMEREGRLQELKRALPVPGAANLIAKIVTSMVFSCVALTLIVAVALVGGETTLSIGQMLIIWSVMIVGSIPFCAIGFFIGAFASASAAPAYGNLLFLPMMWLSGIFIPLPEFLRPWVVVWPAFHLNQFTLGLAGVDNFVFVPISISAGVLLGVTVLFGGLAVRRLARVG